MQNKIWNGIDNSTPKNRHLKFFVCAPSKRKAMQLLKEAGVDVSPYRFNGWWSECGNEEQIDITDEFMNIGVWKKGRTPGKFWSKFKTSEIAEGYWSKPDGGFKQWLENI